MQNQTDSNMIRKIVLFAALALFAAPVSAQKIHRSEVSVSYGVVPVTDWIDTFSSSFTGLFSGTDADPSGWGAVTLGYNLRLTRNLSVGVQAVYSSNEQRVKSIRRSVETRYWSLMPDVKWNWLNLRVVTFYSRLGAGASFSRAKVAGRTDASTRFAFQVSPIGVEVGGRLAAYAEAGIGVSGCFLAGVRYRF